MPPIHHLQKNNVHSAFWVENPISLPSLPTKFFAFLRDLLLFQPETYNKTTGHKRSPSSFLRAFHVTKTITVFLEAKAQPPYYVPVLLIFWMTYFHPISRSSKPLEWLRNLECTVFLTRVFTGYFHCSTKGEAGARCWSHFGSAMLSFSSRLFWSLCLEPFGGRAGNAANCTPVLINSTRSGEHPRETH